MTFLVCLLSLCAVTYVYGSVDNSICPSTVHRSTNLRVFGAHCYEFIFNKQVDWSDAEADCKRKQGHLVDINSAGEQAFVYNTMQVLHFHDDVGIWIGMNDRRHESTWEWSTGHSVSYKNWGSGQPGIVSSFEDCALLEFKSHGEWHDYPCSGFLFSKQTHGWVCKYDIVKPIPTKPTAPPTTVAPTTTTVPTTAVPTTPAPAVETRRTFAPTAAPSTQPPTTTTPAVQVETRRPIVTTSDMNTMESTTTAPPPPPSTDTPSTSHTASFTQ